MRTQEIVYRTHPNWVQFGTNKVYFPALYGLACTSKPFTYLGAVFV